MKHSMTKLPWGLAVLLNLLLLAIVIGCSAATGTPPIDSLLDWNVASPAEGGQFQWQSAGDSPIIHNASVQPTKVRPGDTMVVTAEVSDPSGIESVTANMGGIDTISLSLIEGSIYHGTWQGEWLVHDTTVRDYVTTIVATNSLGKSSATDVPWRDPPSQTFERYHNEVYGTLETTSTDWQAAISCNFRPNVAGDFLIVGRADLGQSSTSHYTEARVVMDESTDNITINTIQFYPALADELAPFGAHEIVSLDTTDHTFEMQYRTSNAVGTANITNYGMSFFAVENYYHACNITSEGTTSTSYVDRITLTDTFTAGEYLVFASMELNSDDISRSSQAQLTYDTTSWGEIIRQPTSASQWHIYEIMRSYNIIAGEHTFKIQYQSEHSSQTTTIRRARISVVRLDELCDLEYYYDEEEAVSGTKETTWQTKSHLEFPLTTFWNGFRAFTGLLGGASDKAYTYASVWEDGGMIGESSVLPNAGGDYTPLWSGFHRYHGSAAASGNWTIELKWMSGDPTKFAYVKNIRLIVLRADTLNPFFDSGHATYLDVFDEAAEDTVYIQGCFYYAEAPYNAVTVTYYDGNNDIVVSDSTADVDANGVIESLLYFPSKPTAEPGTWHAVSTVDAVLTGYGQSIPSSYSANWTYSVRECEFTVTALAIPEFPTVLAGISVAGLCFGIYWWMRKRKLVHVEA